MNQQSINAAWHHLAVAALAAHPGLGWQALADAVSAWAELNDLAVGATPRQIGSLAGFRLQHQVLPRELNAFLTLLEEAPPDHRPWLITWLAAGFVDHFDATATAA